MGLEWRNFRVEDIAAEQPNALATGPFGSAISAKFFVDEGVPVIRGSNLSADIGVRLIDENMVFVSPEKAKEFSRSLVKRGDLVFTCWGTINQVGLIDERSRWHEYIVSNKQMKLTVDPGKAHSTYIYYVFSSPEKQQEILSNGIGAAVPGFNLGQLKKHMLRLPPLETQEAIVRRIQSIDDKIDLNRRINQTLEAMAQAIFKSWFVHFDPVKAKIAAIEQGEDPLRAAMRAISGKTDAQLDQMPREYHDQLAATATLFPDAMEASELGEIPKGWAFQAADLLTEVGIGKTPPRKEPQWFTEGEGDWRWVSIRDMGVSGVFQQRSSEFLTSEAVSRFNVRVVPDRTVLLSFKLTIGRVALTDGPMVTNEAIAHFKLPTDAAISSEYLYLYLKSFDYVMLGSTSSIADAVNSKTIREMPIVVASRSLIDRFTRSVAPLFMEMKNRQNEITSLCATRDALLPKLISGEVEVSL
ncbi:restriction endonuclease subunit S [Achromobacter xylosoxidans]|uniref:restriction endonuclease subunit S n=1 Tax=Alcaligenes xylosoxydans xylosoxydans TaxID=85698 RepID=UPI0022B8C8C1|nr:restriction endonuclease subunit S [Achromobacter xylosoxidans]MCZ8391973.1 restriction endonuclease subunit S [Achromobacter xylosoxidans]